MTPERLEELVEEACRDARRDDERVLAERSEVASDD